MFFFQLTNNYAMMIPQTKVELSKPEREDSFSVIG